MSSSSSGLSLWQWSGWFAIGVVVALAAQWAQVGDSEHDLTFTLRVGEESGARGFIEDELGAIQLTRGAGHDGQYNYLIARDPFLTEGLAELADRPGYRFRRPLLGWAAGAFGFASPTASLFGLTIWAAAGLGLATAALADLAALLGARRWATLGVLANLGLLLSVQLVTSDSLGLGLSLVAVAMVLRSRIALGVVALILAVLAKDAYLLFAVGLAGWLWLQTRRRDATAVLLFPLGTLLAWASWVSTQTTEAFSSGANLTWPFSGLMASVGQWIGTADVVQAAFALTSLVLATVAMIVTRHRLLAWLTLPWLAIALTSSELVWRDGNNAARAFAALWTLGVLGIALNVEQRTPSDPQARTSRRNLPV